MRLPKRGFTNVLAQEIEVVTIKNIFSFIDSKKLDSDIEITKDHLEKAGLIKSKDSKVKLIMSKGNLSDLKIRVLVDSYSEKAKSFS
jgi:ribosomal protein L15